MNANQVSNLLTVSKLFSIGQLALDLHAATNATKEAQQVYYAAIREYEDGDFRLQCGDPGWAELKAATATKYAAYHAAKRIANNIKIRLNNACKKALIGSAA